METAQTPQRWPVLAAALLLLVAGLADGDTAGPRSEDPRYEDPRYEDPPAEALGSPSALPFAGRTIALDAGHEPPFASTDCGRCRWMGSGRSSHFFDIRSSYPDHPLALTAGPYAGALVEYELNQDLVRRVGLLLRLAGAQVVLTRISQSDDSLSVATTDSLVGRAVIHRPLSAAALADLVVTATTRNRRNSQPIEAAFDPGRGESAVRSLENILARGERANRGGADLALVIHADAVNDPAQRGRLLFIYDPGNPQVHDAEYLPPPDGRSLQLANAIEARLQAVPGGIPLTGLFGKDLWYLSVAAMPAVLIEVGRLTHRADADWLSVAANRQELAAAIAGGIQSFLSAAP